MSGWLSRFRTGCLVEWTLLGNVRDIGQSGKKKMWKNAVMDHFIPYWCHKSIRTTYRELSSVQRRCYLK